MYFALYDLTDPGTGAFRDIAKPETHANAKMAMERAIEGLKDVKEHYSIPASLSRECAGGWWHKEVYPNQMWCDGQYMGPALLAQMIHYGYTLDEVCQMNLDKLASRMQRHQIHGEGDER